MAILVFQHNSFGTPARLGDILRDDGHDLRVRRLDKGDTVPVDLDDVDGIVSLGGPMNVDEQSEHPWIADELAYLKQAIDADVPVVGICLGAQLIAAAMGGKVEAMSAAELGWHNIKLAFPGTIDPLCSGLPWQHMQFHLHGQEITELPPGATPLAASKVCKNQAFKVGLKAYGFQYHFEWTKQHLHSILDGRQAWIEKVHGDAEAIRGEIDTYYDMYRHLGDRLSANIANLLFALDKRLGGSREAPKTWDATEST